MRPLKFSVLSFLLFAIQTFGLATGPENEPPAKTQSLRLFIIGNSFSQNASTFLPQLAKEAGHQLTLGRAELGGCSLQRHWEIAAAAEADSSDPKGKAYKGKSLRTLLSDGKWDVVTLQQYSLLSGDVATYQPYAEKLIALVKSIQPDARIVFHQTWAYRSDAVSLGKIDGEKRAADDKEMWEKSRAAYRATAAAAGLKVIPTGDAFRAITSDPQWAYRKDASYNFAQPSPPALPNQSKSLHIGYRWTDGNKLNFDPNHANTTGCYLGSLVWYSFLFQESPEKLAFRPDKVDDVTASHLKEVAWTIVKKGEKEDKKALRK